jgi:hypothetical protein
MAGTALAALGSLYILWFKKDVANVEEKVDSQYPNSEHSYRGRSNHRDASPSQFFTAQSPSITTPNNNALGIRSMSPDDIRLMPTITHTDHDQSMQGVRTQLGKPQSEEHHEPTAGRGRIRKWLTSAGDYLGNAAHEKLDVSNFHDKEASRFPEIPGEDLRNAGLSQIHRQYSQLRERTSSAASYHEHSNASVSNMENGFSLPFVESPQPEISPTRKPVRKNTLEVPVPAHIHRRNESQ